MATSSCRDQYGPTANASSRLAQQLHRCRCEFIDKLEDIDAVINKLYACDVLSIYQKENLQSYDMRSKRVDMLMDIMEKKDDKAINNFLDVVQKLNQANLVLKVRRIPRNDFILELGEVKKKVEALEVAYTLRPNREDTGTQDKLNNVNDLVQYSRGVHKERVDLGKTFEEVDTTFRWRPSPGDTRLQQVIVQNINLSLERHHVLDTHHHANLYDVAVASPGGVYVATPHGMIEYDSRGNVFSRPLPDGHVLSLDVFSDGRVAAGLYPCSVAVLTRGAMQQSIKWKVTANFNTKVRPLCLAVAEDGGRLAIAEWGRVVYFYSCSGEPLLEKSLTYSIRSLSSTKGAVVVSSVDKRSGLQEGHTVEAFDYSGQLLWRRACSNMAYDVCLDPTSRPATTVPHVYATVYGKEGVRILRGEGQQMSDEDIVKGSEALKEPRRISMDAEGRFLAVISLSPNAASVVTVFSVGRR